MRPIEVTISTTTPDAVIHYTTNGDDPTESDPVADAPLVIDQTTILSGARLQGRHDRE